MSSDSDQDYFCGGISEDLITEIARIPSLFVIARHSTFMYKNQLSDVRRIGQELGVLYIVAGSVRRSADRIRITAQLITAQDGMHLWAERYDRGVQDVFAVQDDVVRNIVTALGDKLSVQEPPIRETAPIQNIEAYEWLLKGRQNVFRANGRSAARRPLRRIFKHLSTDIAWQEFLTNTNRRWAGAK